MLAHQIAITSTADSLPATVSLGSTGDTLSTTYDNTDATSSITLKNRADTTLQSFAYTSSPAGTVLNETDTPTSSRSPVVYTYNALSQATSMTPGSGPEENYGFDPSGNLTTLPAGASTTYDYAGELTSSALGGVTTDYTYNADGQRLSAKQGSTTLTNATWNGASQLTGYSDSAATMTDAV